jgi:hypothetical protein
MDHHGEDKEHLPPEDPAIKEAGDKNRDELDKVPAPGTDPLHEGP